MKTFNLTSFYFSGSSTSFLRRLTSLIPLCVKTFLVACAMCVGVMSGASAETIYVNKAQVMAPPDGKKWATAYPTFGEALNRAKSMPPGTATQIWIAEGYYSMPTLDYTTLPDKVDIYGGFQGISSAFPEGESSADQRVLNNNLPAINTALYLYPYFSGSSILPQYVFHLKGTTNTFSGVQFIGAGGILQEGGALTVANCLFSRWAPSGIIVVGGTGVFATKGANLKVRNSSFLDGLAYRGGAIAADNAASVIITGSTFSRNTTIDAQRSEGGAIEINGNQNDIPKPAAIATYGIPQQTAVKIDKNIFTNNSSYLRGGALSIANAGTVSITNSTFGAIDINGLPISSSINKAVRYSSDYSPGNGGAVWLGGNNSVAIYRNNFYGNVASNFGGAIYSTAANVEGTVSITSNKFIQNRADTGGAIGDAKQWSSDGLETVQLTIAGNTFSFNVATANGSAIFYDGTQATINGKSDISAINNALKRQNPTLLLSNISSP